MQPQPHSCSSRVIMEGAASPISRNLTENFGGTLLTGDIKCNHGLKANLDVWKRDKNVGKLFLGSPLWKTNPCGFFRWLPYPDNPTSSSDVNTEEKGKGVEAANEIGKLEAKIMRLKVKKQRLAAENGSLKNQLQQALNERDVLIERERVASRVIYISWVFFLFVMVAIVSKKIF